MVDRVIWVILNTEGNKMEIIEIINYLTNQGVWNKVVSFEPITLGASGAKLFK